MNEIVHKWGGSNPSSLVAKQDGDCIDITYYNTLTYHPHIVEETEMFGHQVIVALETFEEPDVLSVIPLPGWEAVTDNSIIVEEWASGVVRICQMLLG
jgi:hypothetical protein